MLSILNRLYSIFLHKNFIVFIFLFSFVVPSFSQSDFTRFSEKDKITTDFIIKEFKQKGKLGLHDELKILSEKQDASGILHIKMQQYHLGIPIESAYYSFHSKKGFLIAANGALKQVSVDSNKSNIETSKILDIALENINATKYIWEDTALIKQLKKSTIHTNHLEKPTPNLIYYKDGKTYVLAYKIEIQSLLPQGRYIVYVDANSGEILNKIDITTHTTGSCATTYHSTQNIDFDEPTPGNYELTDTTRNIETYVLPNNSIDYAVAQIPTSSFLDWNDINSQDALDVHWGSQVVYDFLSNYGIQSFDNQEGSIVSYVNYGNNNNSRNNAFWNGIFLTYGAGGGNLFPGPVATLDVIAHEIGHALTETYGGGLQYYGESGAINESYSDIIAAAVENFVNISPDYNGLMLNEWVLSDLNGAGLRDMSNPNANNNPDTYQGDFWVSTTGSDNGGVHTNSSLGNYWFYLLANGGSGVNDNGDSFTVNPIGINNAFQIALEAYEYLQNTSDYEQWRAATIFVSELNFDCTVTQEVISAWEAVSVGQLNESCSLVAKIDDVTVTQYCTNTQVTFSFLSSPDATTTWSIDNGAAQTSNTLSFDSEGFHTVTLINTYPSGEIATDAIEIYATDCQPIQGRENTWYISNSSGFDFSSGIATITSYPYESFESTICYSDDQGNLKFYLAALDEDTQESHLIHPDDHSSITELLPLVQSSVQQGVTIPSPSGNLVNVFVANANEGGSGFYRFIVDESTSPVTLTMPVTPITIPNSGVTYGSDGSVKVRENLSAIPSCNENIFWIIANSFGADKKMLVYKLDYSMNAQGDLTFSHEYTPPNAHGNSSCISVSPDGNYIYTKNKLLRFNRANGIISNITDISVDQQSSLFASFSPNSRFLYIKKSPNTLMQYDVLSTDISNSGVPIFTIDSDTNFGAMDIQLGPDGKIYVSYVIPERFVGVINKPNLKQIANEVEFNPIGYQFPISVFLTTRFPSFMKAESANVIPLDFSYALDNCSVINFESPGCKPYYDWDFGDGTTSTAQNPVHTFLNNGTYTVSLTSVVEGQPITITKEVTVTLNTTDLELLAPDTTCENNTTLIAPEGFANYQWTLPNGGGTIQNQGAQNVNVTWSSLGDITIDLLLTDYNDCTNTISHTITVLNEDCDYNVDIDDDIIDDSSDDPTEDDYLLIYPNPAENQLTIKSNIIINQLAVFDVKGRFLFSTIPSNLELGFELNIDHLSNGLYFVELQSENLRQVRKFIKK